MYYENNNRNGYGYTWQLDNIKDYTLAKKLGDMDSFVDDIIEMIEAIVNVQKEYYEYMTHKVYAIK